MSRQPPVRPARSTDAARLKPLQRQLPEPSPALLSAALDSLALSVQTEMAERWRLLVTPDRNDRPVGYLLAVDGSETHIAELVVDPAFRRQNRATALLASVCAETSQPVTVCVAAANSPARSLYEQCGFVESGRNPEQFDSGMGITLRYEPSTA